MKEKRERFSLLNFWRIIYPILVYDGIREVFAIVSGYAITIFLYMTGRDYSKTQDVVNSSMLMMMMFGALAAYPPLIWFIVKDRRRWKEEGVLKKHKLNSKFTYLLIIPFSLFAMYSANLFNQMLFLVVDPGFLEQYESATESIFNANIYLQLLAVGCLVPIGEEMVFRGLIFPRLRRVVGPTFAIIVSGLMFGVWHILPAQMLFTAVIGMLAAWLCEKYKSLLAPIILHMMLNSMSVLINYFAKYLPEDALASGESMPAQAYLIPAVVFGVLAVLFGIIIAKCVKTKEIDG